MKMRFMIVAAVTLAVSAPAAFAQSRLFQSSRAPSADYDGRDRQYELPAGTVLRSGDRLTDRMLVTLWQRTTVSGAGRCSQGACPVIYNGQDMYARRSRISIVDDSRANDRRDNRDRDSRDGRRDDRRDDTNRSRSSSDNRYPEGWSRLQRGDRGENVRRLQELLNRSGARVDTNGNFDQATVNAVREFQRRKRLQSDGVVGYETLRELGV